MPRLTDVDSNRVAPFLYCAVVHENLYEQKPTVSRSFVYRRTAARQSEKAITKPRHTPKPPRKFQDQKLGIKTRPAPPEGLAAPQQSPVLPALPSRVEQLVPLLPPLQPLDPLLVHLGLQQLIPLPLGLGGPLVLDRLGAPLQCPRQHIDPLLPMIRHHSARGNEDEEAMWYNAGM